MEEEKAKIWFFKIFCRQDNITSFLNRNNLKPEEVCIAALYYPYSSQYDVFYYAKKELN